MFPFAIGVRQRIHLELPKRSRWTPTRTAELLDDAGVPPGVYNLIHERQGDRRCADPASAGARAFVVGSTPVAKYIYEQSARRQARAALAGEESPGGDGRTRT